MKKSKGKLKSTPAPTSAGVSRSMKANRSKDTQPELRLRKALRDAGVVGYRLHSRQLPGHPDIVFSRGKVAIFVHGCFWHLCPRCDELRNLRPAKHGAYWRDKQAASKERDRVNLESLTDMGWSTIVVWECEIKRDLFGCVLRIKNALGSAVK